MAAYGQERERRQVAAADSRHDEAQRPEHPARQDQPVRDAAPDDASSDPRAQGDGQRQPRADQRNSQARRQEGDEVGGQANLHGSEKKRRRGQLPERLAGKDHFQRPGDPLESYRPALFPVDVEACPGQLGEEGEEDADRAHRDRRHLPPVEEDQGRNHGPGDRSPQRHAGLLQGERQGQAAGRGGPGQDLGTRGRHRPVPGPDQQGAEDHERDGSRRRGGQPETGEDQAALADPDRAVPQDEIPAGEGGCHATDVDERHEDAEVREGDPRIRGRRGREHGNRDRGHRNQRLDRQRDGQGKDDPGTRFLHCRPRSGNQKAFTISLIQYILSIRDFDHGGLIRYYETLAKVEVKR